MPIFLSDKLIVKCYYREGEHQCVDGLLYQSKELTGDEIPVEVRARAEKMQEVGTEILYLQPILVEKTPLQCPCCEGKGVIPTERGRELITFLHVFLRPMIYEICSDYLDDKLGTS